MLSLLLQELDRIYLTTNQGYLGLMYRTIFLTAYFGLFRSSELTASPGGHAVKAADVQIDFNKKKFMFILRSSKMHNKGNRPQIIKITSTDRSHNYRNVTNTTLQLPCPYQLLREYANARIPYRSQSDNFFIFRDGTPVSATNLRKIFKAVLKSAGFDNKLYSLYSLRSGRAGDLLKLGLPVDTIKKVGRWKSNAVFRYLKYF